MFNNILFYIYLTDVLPSLGCAASFITVLGGFVAVGSLFVGSVMAHGNARFGEKDKDYLLGKATVKFGRRLALWLILPLIIAILTPSKNTMYLMGAGAAVEMAATNPQVQSVAYNSMKLLENKMAELVAEQEKSNKR